MAGVPLPTKAMTEPPDAPGPDRDPDPDPDRDPDAADRPRRRRGLLRRRAAPRKRLSQELTEIAVDPSRPRLSVADLIALLSGRAIAALLLIFAAPNALPAPPGTSSILGLPLVYLSAQMMLGRRPWLPGIIANRSIWRSDFLGLIERAGPLLERAERLLKPRLPALTSPLSERLIGGLILALSIILLLPIPLGNMLPALAICILALGVLERDGLWILGGIALSLAAIALVWGVVWALARAAIFLVLNAF
jgi:hypothetical protein